MVTRAVTRAAVIITATTTGGHHGRFFRCVGSVMFMPGLMAGVCSSTMCMLSATGVQSCQRGMHRSDGQAGRQQQIQECPENRIHHNCESS